MGGSAEVTAAGGVHGFPAELTSFIGRAGPVREVAGLLAEYRLVTVTGPGGAGKTRLAGQVAREVADRFADGVWLAELAPVRGPAQVAAAVAAALGVREQPGVPVAGAVARVLAQAGEQDQAQVALARYAAGVAEEAGAGLQVIAGELAAARWLDAEDATMAHVLGWAVGHDLDTAVRLATALGMWWVLRGQLAGQEPLLRELAGRAEAGSERWCAAEFWLAWTAFDAADLPGALQRCVAVIDVIEDREPSRLLVDCLDMQSAILSNLGRAPEAAAISRRALAMPGSWATRSARRLLRMAWSSRPGTMATWTMLSSWPGRPGRSRTSPARPPGYAATCWPRRWPMRGTWPPPNRPAPPHWLVPGTQATCIAWANC